jgi:glycerol kinase
VSHVDPASVKAIGLTNQRETTIAWNPKTGEALAPAIVWQCRRSASICEQLRQDGLSDIVRERTGLVIDSYFSATKIAWMLENIPEVKNQLTKGEISFGNCDSWVLYNLCKPEGDVGRVFATEPSNACRTMLYSLQEGAWDEDLCRKFSLKESFLPRVKSSFGVFGHANLSGNSVPVSGVLGDQQASLLGHGCLDINSVKCTFGTGAFLLLNAGDSPTSSDSGLLTSVAWSGENTKYALEGSIFVAGSLVQWLRDKLQIIDSSEASEELARSVDSSAGLIVIPSFVGLGAPYWNESVRGAMFGITRDTNRAHIALASLEGIAHQVADLLELPEFSQVNRLNIDGGMVANSLFCQILSDICNITVVCSESGELTALGAARAAAYGSGIFASLSEACAGFAPRAEDEAKNVYSPRGPNQERGKAREAWKKAVSSLIGS